MAASNADLHQPLNGCGRRRGGWGRSVGRGGRGGGYRVGQGCPLEKMSTKEREWETEKPKKIGSNLRVRSSPDPVTHLLRNSDSGLIQFLAEK